MGGTPVTLDFSKAQAINPPANNAPADSSSGVTLDFSKAQHLGPTIGPAKISTLQEAENLTQQGRQDHPVEAAFGDLSKNLKQYGKLLWTMASLVGGPAGEAAGALGAAPAVEAAAGFGKAEQVAAGLEGSTAGAGAPATAGYLSRGATAATEAAQKIGSSMLGVIKSHPIISTYVGTHLADAQGIPLPKVLKAMAGIREVAP